MTLDWKCLAGHSFRAPGQVEPHPCVVCGSPAYPFGIWECEEHARELYQHLGFVRTWRGNKVPRWAEACVERVECEPKCPQHIEIRGKLKETAEALGQRDD